MARGHRCIYLDSRLKRGGFKAGISYRFGVSRRARMLIVNLLIRKQVYRVSISEIS